jgi:hypothetical protein
MAFSCAIRNDSQGFRGKIMEHIWHGKFVNGGSFSMTALGSQAKPIKKQAVETVIFPPLEDVAYETINSLPDQLTENMYYRPYSKTNPTFDSFAILRYDMFGDKKKTEFCMVGFQMTVSEDHPLKI